jgi:general stress protein YciG
MSAIGRKGGETVSQDRGHMEQIGKKGGMAAHAKRSMVPEKRPDNA